MSSAHKPLHFYHFLGSFNLCKLKNNNNQRYTRAARGGTGLCGSLVSTRPCPDYHSPTPPTTSSSSSYVPELQLSPVAAAAVKAPQPRTMIHQARARPLGSGTTPHSKFAINYNPQEAQICPGENREGPAARANRPYSPPTPPSTRAQGVQRVSVPVP